MEVEQSPERSEHVVTNDLLLEISELRIAFPQPSGQWVDVVRGIDLGVSRGEVVGLVGESGSGKTVTCMAAMGLLGAIGARRTGGRLALDGEDVSDASERRWADLRMDVVSMVFQQPRRSLNPAFTVGEQIAEPLRLRRGLSRADAMSAAVDLLDRVGIDRPQERARQYPFELSGGMCQRVMIATAISCQPKLLIADEPTTALDVTVQARILDLLADLCAALDIGMLYVTHDLGVVRDLCDRVVTMYAGQVVETAFVDDVFDQPRHPYTAGLLASTANFNDGDRLHAIPGQVPLPGRLPTGCTFHPRCEHFVTGRCDSDLIPAVDVGPEHSARCIRANEIYQEDR